MMAVVSDKFQTEKQEIQTGLVRLLDDVIETLPYPIIYEPEFAMQDLFKISNVKIESHGSLSERLANLIQIMGMLSKTSLLIGVGMKSYFTLDELEELYKSAFYSKVNLLLVEPIDSKPIRDTEKTWIIDKDRCVISF